MCIFLTIWRPAIDATVGHRIAKATAYTAPRRDSHVDSHGDATPADPVDRVDSLPRVRWTRNPAM